MNLILDKWNDILEYIRKEHELSDVSFETWLTPLKVHSIQDDTVRIIVPMDQMITYLDSKFKIPMYVAIAEFTKNKYDVEFITKMRPQSLIRIKKKKLLPPLPSQNPYQAMSVLKIPASIQNIPLIPLL